MQSKDSPRSGNKQKHTALGRCCCLTVTLILSHTHTHLVRSDNGNAYDATVGSERPTHWLPDACECVWWRVACTTYGVYVSFPHNISMLVAAIADNFRTVKSLRGTSSPSLSLRPSLSLCDCSQCSRCAVYRNPMCVAIVCCCLLLPFVRSLREHTQNMCVGVRKRQQKSQSFASWTVARYTMKTTQ